MKASPVRRAVAAAVGVVAMTVAAAAAQAPSAPRVTSIDADNELYTPSGNVPAGKGRQHVRVRIEGAPGPCIRVPNDFRLIDATGKEVKAIRVSFQMPAQQPAPQNCDMFDIEFAPSKVGAQLARIRMKDATIDLAGAPALRHELRAAYELGFVKLALTAKDEGKTVDVVVQNAGTVARGLYVDQRSYLDVGDRRIVFEPDPRLNIDVSAGGETTVSLKIRQLPNREPWTSGTRTPAPLGKK